MSEPQPVDAVAWGCIFQAMSKVSSYEIGLMLGVPKATSDRLQEEAVNYVRMHGKTMNHRAIDEGLRPKILPKWWPKKVTVEGER